MFCLNNIEGIPGRGEASGDIYVALYIQISGCFAPTSDRWISQPFGDVKCDQSDDYQGDDGGRVKVLQTLHPI